MDAFASNFRKDNKVKKPNMALWVEKKSHKPQLRNSPKRKIQPLQLTNPKTHHHAPILLGRLQIGQSTPD